MSGSSRHNPRWRFELLAVIAGMVLCLPSFRIGFFLDDHIHLAVIEGRLADRDPSASIFRFMDGDVEGNAALARDGWLPWWIDERIKIVFFRPLPDLLFRIDHALNGRNPAGYHLHSIAWWLATLVSVWLLVRRALPGAAGRLTLLLFALDESHAAAAGWIANRHALVAGAPALLAVWAHLRWREDAWRIGRYLAPAALGLGLLGGETAVAGLAYIAGYELLGARDSVQSRAAALAPYALVLTAYGIVYRFGGYGTAASGIYIDPLSEPLRFLGATAERLPTLLSGAILGFPADVWLYAPELRPLLVALGLGGALLLLVLLRSAWPHVAPETRRGVRWLVAGSGLAMLPSAATFPSDRLMMVPSVGILGAIATVLVAAWHSLRTRRRITLKAIAGAALAIIHLVIAPFWLLVSQNGMAALSRETIDLAHSTPTEVIDADQHAILVTASDHVVAIYLPFAFGFVGRPVPAGWRTLSLAPHEHRLTVSGPRTLELEVVGGTMMEGLFERLYRSETSPLVAGTVLDRGLFEVEILDATARGPTRVAFRFDRELDDGRLRFLRWQDGGVGSVVLPAPGDTLDLAREIGPSGF